MVARALPANEVNPELYQLLQGLPPGFKGEILNGALRVVPHAFSGHGAVAARLYAELYGPFQRGLDGPGGWALHVEAQLNLGADVTRPDLSGWRAARRPAEGQFFLQSVPDWVAEVLSNDTWKLDRGPRMEAWARRGTSHVWILDSVDETLEVFWNDAGVMRPLQSFEGRVKVRAAPFDAVELDLALIWPWQPAP